jgi:hypothetical protein
MDDVVLRAMARWPNVPDVYGWLRLDRRGRWLLRTAAGPAGVFDRIGNVAFGAFISRNYQADAEGRWYFQNGPQRVFVGLDGPPWVFRLDDAAREWISHTGAPAGAVSAVLFAEDDSVLLVTALGVGQVLDRDLPALFERLAAPGGAPIDPEALVSSLRAGGPQHVELSGRPVVAESVLQSALPQRFGYVAEPAQPVETARPADGPG